MAAFIYSLIGLFVGAWLNVAADQLPQRRFGLPRCSHCGQKRPPLEWISLLRLLLRRGRCQKCGAPLSLRHPLLEAGSMLSFTLLWRWYAPTPQLLLITFYTCILLLVLVIDLEHRLILNVVIFPSLLVAMAGGSLYRGPLATLAGGVVGFLSFYLISLLRREGMGGGDVKLAAFIGLATGFPEAVVALLIAILLGGATALILVVTRMRSLKSYIPYGPFLVAGGFLALVYGTQMVTWYLSHYQ